MSLIQEFKKTDFLLHNRLFKIVGYSKLISRKQTWWLFEFRSTI